MDISVDTALKIAEVLSILTGGGMVAYRLGRTTQRIEAAMELQRTEISELQGEVKELRALMVQVALQKERLDRHSLQLDRLEALVIPAPRLPVAP